MAALAAGVAAGSLLAALASLPFGGAAPSLRIAVGAALVCGVALARARMQHTRNAARRASATGSATRSSRVAPHRSPAARRDERTRLRAAA